MRALWSSFLLLLCLAACQGPTSLATPAQGVTLALSPPSRTVVPNWSTTVTGYGIRLQCTSGSLPDITQTVGQVSTASIPSVPQGTWTATVTALDTNALGVAAGSATVVVNADGTTSPSTVTVVLSATQDGYGGYSLTFNFPTSSGIDRVTGQLRTAAGGAVASPAGDLVTFTTFGLTGGYRQGRFFQTSVHGGTYLLQMTFYRGGASVGAYSEAINVFDGVTSDRWVSTSGTLAALRTFETTDFGDSNASLLGLLATAAGTPVALSPGFQSAVSNYSETAATSVVFVPTASLSGQKIQYQINGGAWTAISSGLPLPAVAPGNTVRIQVTAADGATSRFYLITLSTPKSMLYVSDVAANQLRIYSVNSATGALANTMNYSLATGLNQLVVHPSGKYLYANYASANLIQMDAIDATTGNLNPTSNTTPQVAVPGEMVIDPSGSYLYVAEGSHNVSSYAIASNGVLAAIGTCDIGFTASGSPSNLQIDPLGHFLYVGNRTNPSLGLSVLSIQNGVLSLAPGYPMAVGIAVIGLEMSPDGTILYLIEDSGASQIEIADIAGTSVVRRPSPLALDAWMNRGGIDPLGKFLYTTRANPYSGICLTPIGAAGTLSYFGGSVASSKLNQGLSFGYGPMTFLPPTPWVFVSDFEDQSLTLYQQDSTTGLLTHVADLAGVKALCAVAVRLPGTP